MFSVKRFCHTASVVFSMKFDVILVQEKLQASNEPSHSVKGQEFID
jgi:hypothetical protein